MADERQWDLDRAQQLLQEVTDSIMATLRDLIEENAQLRAQIAEQNRRLAEYEQRDNTAS